MKKIRYYILTIIAVLSTRTASAQSPTLTKNFVVETTVKVAGRAAFSQLTGLPVTDVNRTIQYMDGLGRPVQTIQWQASPAKKDIVQHIEYDALGREVKKYLPYTDSGSDASYKTSAQSSQQAFYNSSVSNIPVIPQPYSMSVIEPSPLNRALEQGAPGAAWQPYNVGIANSGHTMRLGYGNNAANEVKLWVVTSTGATSSTNYAADRLYKSISRNENWTTGKIGTTEEFKDTEGRVVLKRLWETETKSLSTYYVYDGLGNLRYVLPPAVNENGTDEITTSFTETDNSFLYFIYGYHYDGRKRLIEKKIPGKGWEYMVYNKLDQLVLSQDANQRAINRWSFTKYDALGRAVITGLYNNGGARATLQGFVDAEAQLWETRDDANANGLGIGYSSSAFPQLNIHSYHAINYFDDYLFYTNNFGAPVAPQAGNEGTRGLPTGNRVNVLGTTTMLLTVMYYDDEGRVVQTKSANHLVGTDRVDNAYNFAGELTSSTRTHVASGSTTTIANSFTYDHVGRKISTRENINGQGEVTLNRLVYNEIGQLKEKQLHSTDGTTFLQATKFSYNERGWLKGSKSPEFSMKLGYDTLAYAQYDGNISTQEWGTSYANKFIYQYDRLNRLVNGSTTAGTISMGEVLTYDVMGNILTLDRDGAGNGSYSYVGNQLTGISGGGLTTGSYAYDANGNATTDGRTGVALTYNYLNLPVTATKSDLSLAYTYDATGKKLTKVKSSGTPETIDYLDGIQYKNGAIDFIQTEEGIARKSGNNYIYEYNLTDHLGNVRYSFRKSSSSFTVEPLQSDDYYAFGKRKVGAIAGSNDNKYLYNGKELQDELGQYDYGARFYDAEIGRWNVVDPLAEISRKFSPYVYGNNNPVRFIDVDGMYVYGGETGAYENGQDNFDDVLKYYGIGQNASTTQDDPKKKEQENQQDDPKPKKKKEIVAKDTSPNIGFGSMLTAGLAISGYGGNVSIGFFGSPHRMGQGFISFGKANGLEAGVSQQYLVGKTSQENWDVSGSGKSLGGGYGPVAGSYSTVDGGAYSIYGIGPAVSVKGAPKTGASYSETKTYTFPVPWPKLWNAVGLRF